MLLSSHSLQRQSESPKSLEEVELREYAALDSMIPSTPHLILLNRCEDLFTPIIYIIGCQQYCFAVWSNSSTKNTGQKPKERTNRAQHNHDVRYCKPGTRGT